MATAEQPPDSEDSDARSAALHSDILQQSGFASALRDPDDETTSTWLASTWLDRSSRKHATIVSATVLTSLVAFLFILRKFYLKLTAAKNEPGETQEKPKTEKISQEELMLSSLSKEELRDLARVLLKGQTIPPPSLPKIKEEPKTKSVVLMDDYYYDYSDTPEYLQHLE